MRLFADVGEGTVAIVVIENVLAVVGDVEILPAVVVVIPDADALAPTSVGQTGFGADIGERAIMVVVIEVVCGAFAGGQLFQCCAVDDKYFRPVVICIIVVVNVGPGSLIDIIL